MNATISQGTLLIREDALLPRSMDLRGLPFSKGWTRIGPEERPELERQIADAGWTFFYLAGQVKATAFGHDEKAEYRAMERILAGPETRKFNCMEVMSSKTVKFLGMPFVTLTAHARHIQQSNMLQPPRWPAKRSQQSWEPKIQPEPHERGTHVVNQW